ncbi:multidrug effflux MFS transporter [Vibrio stylophorae]|uniref:multidrug effflux MFS transporter n=1 Tax=Vibrio stylophorae TaxID=659351 RepID=UPI0025B63C67|nr:multidrug effflux MFS transporter [Vibrio stylophorae]
MSHPDSYFAPSKLQLTMLTLLVLFSPLAIDIYLPALPLIARDFSVNHTLAQDTITWFLFAMGLGQLFAGPLADKWGRRVIALSGIAIYGVSSALAWWAQNIEWMLTARLLQGCGACATSVAAFATVRDLFGPKKSGKMISYLNGAICFIPALAPILGSYLTQHLGWRANFSFMAGYAFVVFAMALCAMRETNPNPSQQAVFQPSRYWAVLSNTSFLFHASLCLLAMAVILAYVTSAPVVLMQNLGLDMQQFTFWFGLNAVLNIAACFIGPKYMERVGPHRTLVTGVLLLGMAGFLMLALAKEHTALAFMLPIFISSVGFALILGAAAGQALAPFGDKAGTAAALLGLFQMSGAGLLVGLMQRLGLSAQWMISLQMWFLLPALLILFSRLKYRWYAIPESQSATQSE